MNSFYGATGQTYLFEGLYMLGAIAMGVPAAMAWLNWMDRRNAKGKSHFSAHFRAMQDDPVALANYLGKRFIGVSIMVGLIAVAFLLR